MELLPTLHINRPLEIRKMAQLFQGKLHLVSMTYSSGSQSASVIESDLQVICRTDDSDAIVPISQYAFQYGPNSLALADTNANTLIPFQTPDLSVTGGTFSIMTFRAGLT